MKIKVTAENIARGEKNNPWSCPIALALHRQFPNADVSVSRNRIAFKTCKYLLPNEARIFVDRFDSGKSIEPFEFEVSK